MKNIKKIKSFFSLFSILLTSCGSNVKDVSIYIYDFNDVFIHSLKNDITEALSNKGLDYVTYDAQLSQIIQNEQIIHDMDNHASKVYVVNPMDRLSTGALIEKANKYQYPVIFFNREPLSEDMNKGRENNPNLFYVGTDPVFEGKTQADMLMDLFGEPNSLNPKYDKNRDGIIQMLLMKGEISHQDTEKRSKGVLNEFKDKGYSVNVVESVYCNWSKELAMQSMPDIMRDYGSQIEVIVSNNDDMALGVIQYLQEEYKKTESIADSVESLQDFEMPFPIVGVDGIKDSIEAIQAGYLYGTVKNNGKKQAETITSLVEYVLGNKYSIVDLIPDKDNEYAYYIEGERLTKDSLNLN